MDGKSCSLRRDSVGVWWVRVQAEMWDCGHNGGCQKIIPDASPPNHSMLLKLHKKMDSKLTILHHCLSFTQLASCGSYLSIYLSISHSFVLTWIDPSPPSLATPQIYDLLMALCLSTNYLLPALHDEVSFQYRSSCTVLLYACQVFSFHFSKLSG